MESLEIMKKILCKFEASFESYVSRKELDEFIQEELASYKIEKIHRVFDLLKDKRFIKLTTEYRSPGNLKENYEITFDGILFLSGLI